MATSSLTAGYLAPTAEPAYDNALDDVLQSAIVGITGLPGNLVRPRWQPNPPNQPAFDTNWCAFGIPRNVSDAFAYESHDPDGAAGAGVVSVDRDEMLYVLHSFYGPSASALSKRLRDGLELAQNRAELSAQGVAVVEVQESVTLPALLQERWVRRVDTTVIYRRRTSRTFQVRTIVEGSLGLDNEHYVTPINVNP